jgi:hypothetical protein
MREFALGKRLGDTARDRCLGCRGKPAGASHEQNRMAKELTFAEFAARLRGYIRIGMQASIGLREGTALHRAGLPPHERSSQSLVAPTAAKFESLALELFRLQFESNMPYRRFCEHRGVTPVGISSCRQIPAVPASAFKELDLTSLSPHERTTVFLSSGTSGQTRSRHFHNAESLALYEASLLPWFEQHLLADVNDLVDEQLLGPLDKLPFLALTPPPTEAPHSSLVHMLDCVRRLFGSRDSLFAGRVNANAAWILNMDATLFAIRKSMCANRPLVLLGTAFNFVHLLDHFVDHNIRYRLAHGSRVMETGGYKGQSRQVPKAELHALITKHLGIPSENIVTEYGMSELSSQAYDRVAGIARPASMTRHSHPERIGSPFCALHFPPWACAQVVSPETGAEVSEGETGLLRIFDLANVRSVMAIQTEDLAVRRGNGFELLGRANAADPRGCSLMSQNSE